MTIAYFNIKKIHLGKMLRWDLGKLVLMRFMFL